MEKVSCNNCGNKIFLPLFETKDRLYRTTKKNFWLMKCRVCNLVCLDPMPKSEEVAAYYPSLYRPYQERPSQTKKYIFPQNPAHRFLDCGCGTGDFLEELLEQHPNAGLYGVDIDQRAAKSAKAKGFVVKKGSLFEANFPDAFFDRVYMNHVLEHLPDPRETTKEAFRIIKPGGTITIVVPNFGSLSRLIFRSYWYHIDTPRHLHHFYPGTLKQMLLGAGFSDVEFTYIPSPKYFLQSIALWQHGEKRAYPKIVWKALMPFAKLISKIRLSSTVRVVAQKS